MNTAEPLSPHPDPRQGASLSSPAHAPPTPDLPLLVWLKGDEPYFAEFTLDAETVMQQLGIKRSRLTQISGTELRVGRARIDRYIRPVYRPCDIEEYAAWTRATASHHKSSTLLEQAALKLEVSSRDFAGQLDALHQAIAKNQQRLLTHHRHDLVNTLRHLLQRGTEITLHLQQRRHDQQERSERAQQHLVQTLHDELAHIHAALGELTSVGPSLEEMMGSLRYLHQRLLHLYHQVMRDQEADGERWDALLGKIACLDEKLAGLAASPQHAAALPLRRLKPNPRCRRVQQMPPSSQPAAPPGFQRRNYSRRKP